MTVVINSRELRKPEQTWDFKTLRLIAQRQIASLLRRMEVSKNHSLYREEIRKIIEHELAIKGDDPYD